MVQTVIKRDGREVEFDINKIRKQIEFAVDGTGISPLEFESLVHLELKPKMKTSEIQESLIQAAVKNISTEKPEWNLVSGRAQMYQLYRQVYKNIKKDVQEWKDIILYLVHNGYYRSDIAQYLDNLSDKSIKYLDNLTSSYSNLYDFKLVFSQVKVLETKYLIKHSRGVIEYPVIADIANALILSNGKDMFLDIFKAVHTQEISLATPFKRNLRRPNGNTVSCFIGENIDSLAGIMKAVTDMAFMSKEGGGIGWYWGKVRSSLHSTYKIPKANEVNLWLKLANDIAVAVNQAGTRKGAITVAVDWWHPDIESFLEMKSQIKGDSRLKCLDLFPQVVVDNYFIDAVINNRDIYLYDAVEIKTKHNLDITELVDRDLYEAHHKFQQLASEGKLRHRKINAKYLWKEMLKTWIEVGDFYITHKDNLNISNYLKYDPDNWGIAKCGNLCVESFSLTKAATSWVEKAKGSDREVIESDGLYHSCSLISINVAKLAKINKEEKLNEKVEKLAELAVYMLDKSIDETVPPSLEAYTNQKNLRNIGIGFVGLYDYVVYHKLNYDTKEGQLLAEKIVEKFAYYSYKASIKLAEQYGAYPLFDANNYDTVLGKDPNLLVHRSKETGNNFDWVHLASQIREKGIRNFLLLAIAPNTTSGIVQGVTASYLPPQDRIFYQTLADMSVPILPPFIKSRYWYYKTKFQYHPKTIVELTRRLQYWIDTGISMEMDINPDICKINEISDAILEGFKAGELKAVYYSLTIGRQAKNKCESCAN